MKKGSKKRKESEIAYEKELQKLKPEIEPFVMPDYAHVYIHEEGCDFDETAHYELLNQNLLGPSSKFERLMEYESAREKLYYQMRLKRPFRAPKGPSAKEIAENPFVKQYLEEQWDSVSSKRPHYYKMCYCKLTAVKPKSPESDIVYGVIAPPLVKVESPQNGAELQEPSKQPEPVNEEIKEEVNEESKTVAIPSEDENSCDNDKIREMLLASLHDDLNLSSQSHDEDEDELVVE